MADQKTTPRWMLPLLLTVALALSAFGIWQTWGGSGSAPNGASTAAPSPSVVPSVEPVGPAPAESPSAPSATSESPAPEDSPDEGDGHEHAWDEGEEFMPGTAPSYEPNGDREPQGDDDTAARTALESVVPAWASIDLASDRSPSAWLDTFSGAAGSSNEFEAVSLRRYADLFSGALQGDLSIQDASVTRQKRLWNLGGESLWRVTVERDLVSNQGIDALNRSEKSTWDFRVDQNGEQFTVVDFSNPTKTNESPATYVPERVE